MSALLPFDLSQLPPPAAIEPLSPEALKGDFKSRFVAAWDELRATRPDLPLYTVEGLETDPAIIAARAWCAQRLLDRARVNDAVRAVLAPLASGTDLDNVVARLGVQRLVLVPATETTAAIMESDQQLLRRYLLAFERPSAGSADRYMYEAYTAVPTLQDVAVIGRAVHGRRGDTDIVIAGAGGADATDEQLAAVRAAVTASGVKPEAVSLTVLRAVRHTYAAAMTLLIPPGPDAGLIKAAAEAAIAAAGKLRLAIGGEVPVDAIVGPAYVAGVVRVVRQLPAGDLAADPYAIPVLDTVTIATGAAS